MSKFKNALVGVGSVIGFSFLTLATTSYIDLYNSPAQFVSKDAIEEVSSSKMQEYLELSDGIYLGDVSADMMNGEGVITFETGDVIEGKFENNEIGDDSKLIIAGVGTYIGEFENNERSGEGTFTWENGDVLKCNWEKDVPTGQGTLNYANGDVLEGEFSDGHLDKGTFKTNISDIEFVYQVEDSKLGDVSFTTADDVDCNGSYSDGKLNGKCTVEFPDGSKYEGNLKNNMRDGEGVYTWADGSTYSGHWENDKMNGTGTYTWNSSENTIKGQWKDNVPDGNMTLTLDSKSYTAEFKDGKCTAVKKG